MKKSIVVFFNFSLINNHVRSSYVAFEEPQINYLFHGKLSYLERNFRRRFIETHELLGRGKILTSFVNDDVSYIENIARKRVSIINKNMRKNGDKIYVDVSKYFARGLHIGFQRVIPLFSLVHLVRDPILNMRSFLNRHKNFFLDNNSPDDKNNHLIMDPHEMESSELYLWAWCEMALRYESLKTLSYVDRYVEIHTNKLNNPDYMNKCLDNLQLSHSKIKENSILLNTNIESGYERTEVTKSDILIFENFINKISSSIVNKIPYLQSYDPSSIHQI